MVEDCASKKSEELVPPAASGSLVNRTTRSKRKAVQKNVTDEETCNGSSGELAGRKRLREKLEKEELESRFSYVPKKMKVEVIQRSDEQIPCCSGTGESCSTSGKSATTAVKKSEFNILKQKADMEFKFTRRLSTSQIEVDHLATHESLVSKSHNILQYVNMVSQGSVCSVTLKQAKRRCIVNRISTMESCAFSRPFERRVTALTYHPKYPSILAAGSKGGEVILWNMGAQNHDLKKIPGVGPGGSILALKFHPELPNIVYTASLTGIVMQQDVLGQEQITFFDAQNINVWFCSMDTSVSQKIILAGDTQGFLHFSDFEGRKVWKSKAKLHKGKVTHAEFSTRDPYTFVTASLDHTVKIWDLRMFSSQAEKNESIHTLLHEKAVNCAYFSPSNGTSLLTTDQNKEIRVYIAPLWELETLIEHPHRQFQHMTPIKAQWHTLEDLIVVGRYPDKKVSEDDLRSIDIYDAHTGKREHLFRSNTIASLNAFSPTGEFLVSASGTSITWRRSESEEQNALRSTRYVFKGRAIHGIRSIVKGAFAPRLRDLSGATKKY